MSSDPNVVKHDMLGKGRELCDCGTQSDKPEEHNEKCVYRLMNATLTATIEYTEQELLALLFMLNRLMQIDTPVFSKNGGETLLQKAQGAVAIMASFRSTGKPPPEILTMQQGG